MFGNQLAIPTLGSLNTLIFPSSSFILSMNIQVEEEFLADSTQISTMRHSSIKLNEWISLDLVVFTVYYFKEPRFEVKFSRGTCVFKR